MVALHESRRPRTPAACGGLVLLCLLLLPLAGRAGPPSGNQTEDGVYCWKERKFGIPIADGAPGQNGIRQVILYVSEDYGKTYQYLSTAEKGQTRFSVEVKRDGLYFFALQIQGSDGQFSPRDMKQVQPALKVLVDNKPPEISVRAATPSGGSVAMSWTIKDDCPDVATLQGYYRPTGTQQNWARFDVPRLLNGSHSWTPPMPGPVDVYLEMSDKAGNVGHSDPVTLTPGVGGPGPNVGPGTGPERTRPDLPRGADYMLTNKTEFPLAFDVVEEGKSGIAEIEVWVKRDGKPWELRRELGGKDKKSPLAIRVDGEGRYGFTLIAISGVGERYEKPGDNEAAQIIVDVDTTPPKVNIIGAPIVGRDRDAGKLTINYRASDPNTTLGPRPVKIRIGYAATPDARDWTPIAQDLSNDIQYVWQMPEGLPLQFYVRVEAVDQAGNSASAVTAQPVKVDLVKPRVPPRLDQPGPMPGP